MIGAAFSTRKNEENMPHSGRKTLRNEELGKPRSRRENYIKMNYTEIRWMMWSGLSWLKEGSSGGMF
jgi:hypothetical protein